MAEAGDTFDNVISSDKSKTKTSKESGDTLSLYPKEANRTWLIACNNSLYY